MLSRSLFKRTALLTEVLEILGERRGSHWVQTTQYEYRLNPDGKGATVAGSVRGEAHRGRDKHAEYLGVVGGELDEKGKFKRGGMKKYFKDEEGKEKVESKGDENPEQFMEKLGVEKPKEFDKLNFPSSPKSSHLTGDFEDVMEDLVTLPTKKKRNLLK